MLHVAGNCDYERVAAAAANPGHKVRGFGDRMPEAYGCADLIVTRSGASSLTEISAAGLPSILVPYPHAADDHQARNAEVFVKAGAAQMAREDQLTGEGMAGMITAILEDSTDRQTMADASRSLSVPNAAERVCEAIESVLTSS